MKTILISGASGGIGSAIAKTFAKQNNNLILIYNSNKPPVANLKNCNIELVKCDLTNTNLITEMVSKIIKKYNQVNRIFLIDKASNIKNEIETASLFVLPSNYEGMPNSLLEAMALSLPVISTNSTEVIEDIIVNNVNGIVVEKNNPKILTGKMEYILNNFKFSEKISKEAAKVKEKYNKEIIIKKWYELLMKIDE